VDGVGYSEGDGSGTDLPVLHVNGFQHRLIEATAHGRSSPKVRRVAVAGQLDRRSEEVLPTIEVSLCDVEFLLRRPLLRGDAILLRLQRSSGIAFA
jgi:hypothetical protein